MRTAREGIVQRRDVAAPETEIRDCGPHREGSRAEMHRNMRGLCDQLAARVENRAREIVPLLDVGGERGLAEHDPHLVGNRSKAIVHHRQRDRIEFHRAASNCRLPKSSTRKVNSGATYAVELSSTTTIGPRTRAPAPSASRLKIGTTRCRPPTSTLPREIGDGFPSWRAIRRGL